MRSNFSSVKKFFILFAIVTTVLTLALTGPFGYVLASSPYAPVFAQVFGALGEGDGQFTSPAGIEIAENGAIYVSDTDFVSDTANGRIEIFDGNGVYQSEINTFNGGDSFYSPRGIATDASGNIYVADSGGNRIVKFNASGSFIKSWGSYGVTDGAFKEPYDVAVDTINSKIYVADTRNHRIQKFDLEGNFLAKWGAYGSGDSQFNSPSGIAVDSSGNVYVADTNNNRIKKLSPDGVLLEKFGAAGSADGQFSQPRGIAVDSENTLYVLDSGNNRIQKLSTTDKITFVTKWGAAGSGNGQFSVPYAIAARDADTVIVADTSNNRVQRFEPDQAPTFMDINNSRVKENLPGGTLVGTFSTQDANANDTFSYAFITSCGGADNNAFTITGNQLFTAAPLSLEVKETYGICVRVTDSGGATYFRPFLITVENVNDAPVINDQFLPPFSEAAPNGTVVGTLTASDPDSNDSLKFSKTGGTGSGALDVYEDGRVVVANSSLLDYETQSSLSLNVKVTDIAGASDTAVVTLFVTDANDAPVPGSLVGYLDENSPQKTAVKLEDNLTDLNLTHTDQDFPAQNMTWEIIGYQPVEVKDSIQFLIDPVYNRWSKITTQTDPQLRVANSYVMDYEKYPDITLTIRVTDDGFPRRYTDFTVPIHLNNVNEPPQCAGLYNVWMPENSKVGTSTDFIRVFDPERNIPTFSIIGGDPIGANFKLTPAGVDKTNALAVLTMTTQVDLNYEVAVPYYDLEIDVKDSANLTCKDYIYHPDKVTLRLNINSVAEAPYFPNDAIRPPNPDLGSNVDEYTPDGPAQGTVVTNVYALDPDAFGSSSPNLYYEIIAGNPGPSNNRLFKMNQVEYQTTPYKMNYGEIVVNNPSLLNFETTPTYSLTIQVRDGTWKMATLTVPITVNDKNDPPKINPQTFYGTEGASVGTEFGQLVATDPDKNDTHTFALVPSGTGTDPFSVTPEGKILVADSSQMIDGKSYTIRVRATDNGTPPYSGEGNVTVNVSNGNNAPTIESQGFSVEENTASGTDVYHIVASDHENNTITYSIGAGGDALAQSAFAVNPTSGVITISDASVLNYESSAITNHTLTLNVHAQDNGTPSKGRDAPVTITIDDVNEAPVVNSLTLHVNENTAKNDVIGALSASDPDIESTLSYTIVDGNTGDAFSLEQDGSFRVLTPELLDYETTPSPYHLNINITDNGSPAITTPTTVTITVDNVNEPALVEPASFTVNENSLAKEEVGTIVAMDQDVPPDNLVFTILSGNDGGVFALDNTGKLTVNQNYAINYEVKASYTLSVQVSDTTAHPAVAGPFDVIVAVNDLDEAPEWESSIYNLEIGDRATADTAGIVGQVKATDPESKLVGYQIMGGNIDDTFALGREDGKITLNKGKVIDYGKNELYNLTVSASDGFNISISQVNIAVSSHPDLSLTVKAPNHVLASTRLKFEVQVKNTGYKTSKPYTLTITTPAQVTFDPMDSWLDCRATDATTVTCANSANGISGQGYLNITVYFKVNSSVTDHTPLPVAVNLNPTDNDDMDMSNNAWGNTITGWKDTVPLYSETFSSSPDLSAFWAVGGAAPSTASAPSGEKYLGALANDKLSYASELLPSHQSVTVSFDVYIIGDWSGNDPSDGPDQWEVQASGSSLFTTTFSNRTGINQSYPALVLLGSNAPFTGSKAVNALQTGKDATYHLTYTFNHIDPILKLSFLANLPKPGNKTWGIDNIVITVTNQSGGWNVFLPFTRK